MELLAAKEVDVASGLGGEQNRGLRSGMPVAGNCPMVIWSVGQFNHQCRRTCSVLSSNLPVPEWHTIITYHKVFFIDAVATQQSLLYPSTVDSHSCFNH